jgi:Cu(I)/Ag(I) efflux system membrane protein CusA/SilA
VNRLIRFCLERKLVVLLMVLLVVGWGLMTAPFDWEWKGIPRDPVPVDAIPDIGENQQIVFTQWMGRSPQDVEDQITYPMTVALLGIPGVKTVRSYSFFGFSSIYVIFEESVDFYWSRSRLLEKLASLPAGTLPKGVKPALGPDATALGQVYWYTLEGRDPEGNPTGGWGLDELRTAQDWYVRYALLAADGVSEAASIGGHVREYQVDVNPDAMRAHKVSLTEVVNAVRGSNLDVGARTIEINRVEYMVRGLGFVKTVGDLEQVVVRVNDNVPIRLTDIAKITLGPSLRRGALDKEGVEAVGGVVVVRYGHNPLAAIKNIKAKIKEIAPGLPRKVLVDFEQVSPAEVSAFAAEQGFVAFTGSELNRDAWVKWASANVASLPPWLTLTQITVVPFYDRTGLIHETLGTLETALTEEILISIIVVIALVLHLSSSLLISGLLPLAVLICFIAMRLFGVDANVVALSGIAIAIGTMVDMGIILCENILRNLDEAGPDEDRLEVIHRAACEVGGAVLTAVSTTIVSFLPVFAMEAAEGKLFKPLAFTKSFALAGSIIVALTIIPPAAHILFQRGRGAWHRYVAPTGLLLLGLFALLHMPVIGVLVLLMGVVGCLRPRFEDRSEAVERGLTYLSNGLAVVAVAWFLNEHWLPLGPEKGLLTNFAFTGGMIGGLLAAFMVFLKAYPTLLRLCLTYKKTFLLLPTVILTLGVAAWLGAKVVFPWGPAVALGLLAAAWAHGALRSLVPPHLGLQSLGLQTTWSFRVQRSLRAAGPALGALLVLVGVSTLLALAYESTPLSRPRSSLEHAVPGLGKEFMPPLDEGSYLYMPTTMPHASIGEATDVLRKLDLAMASVPEVAQVVGKLGRVESPLDPAPISMIETVINYKSEYLTDEQGRRLRFRFDEGSKEYTRDASGALIPDSEGVPFRQWRDHIRKPDDIWDELVKVAKLPGTTSAPRLQPIAARIVMLQSGMRAPMGVKVKGPDLPTIEKVCLDIERFLKEVPSVAPAAVIADRIVGKPYLEIEINRGAIARHGLKIAQVQEVIEVAIGGKPLTTTVEGRERYPVRVRYPRELRDSIESIGAIYVPTPDGHQIPLIELAEIRYVRGPQVIKSEDTFLTGYVLFDMKKGEAEVAVVEACLAYLESKVESGELQIPAGVSYTFAGSYENQVRSENKLRIVLPLALFIIFLILYFQFSRVSTTLLVFSGIAVAWAGGFIMIWLYGQDWFLDFSILGTNMRQLFSVHPINLSVAIWVGFIALFGIATDDGVVVATYLDQTFEASQPSTPEEIRAATLEAGSRRIRPCLMTTATTLLALVPVLTSTGRGSDIMLPMAIPSFGGMCVELVTLFVVPTLYCAIAEARLAASERLPEPTPAPSS